MRAPSLVVVVALAGALAACEIRPPHPLDPDTDVAFQQRASLRGAVRAVVAPDDDDSVPAPGPPSTTGSRDTDENVDPTLPSPCKERGWG